MARKKANRDRWPDLCDRVSHDDGLPCREVGAWTEDKLFTWNRYVEITSKAMGDNPKWSGIVYVDLFGGPGICRVRESGKRIPGSPLLAAFAPKPFRKILICEKDAQLAAASEKRLAEANASEQSKVFVRNCNDVIQDVVAEIPERALTLAFIDPEGLHVYFETLRSLTWERKVDLAVLFADRMDIVRNVELYYQQKDSNLDRVIGPDSDWRHRWRNLPNQDAAHTCQLFGDIYKNQLQLLLGYREFRDQVYRSQKSVLYRVIYASKHKLGARFVDKISKVNRGGQRDLPFAD